MKKLPGGKLAAYITAILLLIFTSIWSSYTSTQMRQHVSLLQASTKYIDNLQLLQLNIPKAAASFRTFLITNDSTYIADFENAVIERDSVVREIETLASLNSRPESFARQEEKIFSLAADQANYIKEGFSLKARVIADDNMGDSLLVKYVNNKAISSKNINTEIDQLIQTETDFIKERDVTIKSYSQTIILLNFLAGIISIAFIMWAGVSFFKENAERQKAQEEGDIYKAELERRIQQLNNANKSLEELKDEEKFSSTGRIARVIAHEVKNPITNINLAIDQLEEGIEQNEDNDMMLGIVKRNSARINTLISNLLNATKFIELRFEPLNLHDVLNESVTSINDSAELNGIEIEKRFLATNASLPLDKEKIEIAFNNLMVNAIEAMAEDEQNKTGKKLIVETHDQEGELIILFSDNGKGIETKMLNSIFEPYFTAKKSGSGLGLTNTRNIIRNHGGKITVKSKVGKGTTFRVVLPKN